MNVWECLTPLSLLGIAYLLLFAGTFRTAAQSGQQ
jgi:hypothetical protein